MEKKTAASLQIYSLVIFAFGLSFLWRIILRGEATHGLLFYYLVCFLCGLGIQRTIPANLQKQSLLFPKVSLWLEQLLRILLLVVLSYLFYCL